MLLDLLSSAVGSEALVGFVDLLLQLRQGPVTTAGLQLQNVAASLGKDAEAVLAQCMHAAVFRQLGLVAPLAEVAT